MAQSDIERAGQLLTSAYARLEHTGARPAILDAVASTAGLLIAEAADDRRKLPDPERHRRLERATELLAHVSRDPAAWFLTRRRAETLLADLSDRLPAPVFNAARERGHRQRLGDFTLLSHDVLTSSSG